MLGKKLHQAAAVALLALWAAANSLAANPERVSERYSGEMLTAESIGGTKLTTLDISDDGHYVLFANYEPGISVFGGPPGPNNCRIYRKNLRTGGLRKVFENDGELSFCRGAKMSADGNIVVASPDAPPSDTCVYLLETRQWDCGKIATLVAKNLTHDQQKIVYTELRSSLELDGSSLVGSLIASLTPDGNTAVIVKPNVVSHLAALQYQIINIDSGAVETFDPDLEDAPDSPIIGNFFPSVSPDGKRIALIDNCQDWQKCVISTYPPTPVESCPPTEAPLYVIDRDTGVTEIVDTLLFDSDQNVPNLGSKAWSTDGDYLSWVEIPNFPVGCSYAPDGQPFCPSTTCVAEECEVTVVRYRITDGSTTRIRTPYDPDTTSLCQTQYLYQKTQVPCGIQLSRGGEKVLYGRSVRYPFGQDWQAPSRILTPLCVTADSVEVPGSGVTYVDCPISPVPPFPLPPYYFPTPVPNWQQAYFGTPVNLYTLDVITGESKMVSQLDDGNLYQNSGAMFSADGETVVVSSRDPRLRKDLTDGAGLDETELPEECFWSPDGHDGNLRIATNDNTRYKHDESNGGFFFVPDLPAWCRIPAPVIDAQLFAIDVSSGSSSGGSSAFAFLFFPLFTLLAIRRLANLKK